MITEKMKDKNGKYQVVKSESLVSSPIISVIMSVYNGAKYLSEAIDSILNQTFKNFEFIIINDGSTDDSLKVLQQYQIKDGRIIIIDQENIGLTKSLNRGIEIAKGEYIARMDADDKSLPERFENQIEALKNNNLDFLTGLAIKKNKIVPNKLLLFFNRYSALQTGNLFVHGTFFGKRSLFKEVLYNEEFYYAQDFRFIMDIVRKNYKIGILLKPLYKLNDHPVNISNTMTEEQLRFAYRTITQEFKGNALFAKIIHSLHKIHLGNIARLLFVIWLYLCSKNKAEFKIIK